MTTFNTTLRAAAAALVLTTGFAHADLSAADQAQIDGKSGLRVFTSDGAYLGITNGLRFFNGDRIRMFIVTKAGSKFRPKVDEVNLTTFTDKVTLQGSDLILDATRQKLRAATPPKDDFQDDALSVALLHR